MKIDYSISSDIRLKKNHDNDERVLIASNESRRARYVLTIKFSSESNLIK